MMNTHHKNTDKKTKPVEFVLYDHFTNPLMFRSLGEVSEYLNHNPFSYYDPPDEDKGWNVVNIISYRDIMTLKKIIDKCINSGSFKLMNPPKMLSSVIEALKNTKIAKTVIPTETTVYFVKIFNEMDTLLAIKPTKKNDIRIIISMSDQDLYAYYKYIFVLANIFNVKF
jgi:hypothetical protein